MVCVRIRNWQIQSWQEWWLCFTKATNARSDSRNPTKNVFSPSGQTRLRRSSQQFSCNRNQINRSNGKHYPTQSYATLPQGQWDHSTKTPFKMKIPCFDVLIHWDGFKLIIFFLNFHSIQEQQHISMASFYLDVPALNLYQWMYNKNQLTSWTNFYMHYEFLLLCPNLRTHKEHYLK